MFRSLAARLTATYVFAAVVLVIITVCAVTAFVLSMFGLSAREETDDVARHAPEVVRLEIARTGSLESAAVSIVRELSRPGLHVAVFALHGGRRRFLAVSATAPRDGRPIVIEAPRELERPGFVPLVSIPTARMPPAALATARSAGPAFGIGAPFADERFPESDLGNGPRPFWDDRGYARAPRADVAHMPPAEMDRARSYPLGLNAILHIEPKDVNVEGGRIGILPDPEPLARAIDRFWLAMLPIGAFAILAAWWLGRFITLQALRPLVETTESLARFGAGDFTPRSIMTAQRNEFGALVSAYNRAASQVARALAEREAAEEQMRQFIADAGHELRTPLTVIMGFIDVLRKRAQSDPTSSTKIFDTMLEESRRMKALIDTLIVLARLENQPARELETVDLAEVTRKVVASLQALRPSAPIAFGGETALVRGNETELHDAIANILENAVKYAPDASIEVRVGGEGAVAVVDVSDSGPGIATDEQTHVFDRFYRGRDRTTADGFGLGLAIAKRAVERAGGTIALTSSPGAGSRFSIRIPYASPAGVALAS